CRSGPHSGRTVAGTLIDVSPTSLTVLVGREPYVLRRDSVRKVWSGTRRSPWGIPLSGIDPGALAVGLGGAAFCRGTDSERESCVERAVGIGFVGGMVAGTLVWLHSRHVAYDAEPPHHPQLALRPLIGRRSAGCSLSFHF